MNAVELLPQGAEPQRPAMTAYEWPLAAGASDTLLADLSWSLAELGSPSSAAKDLLRVVTAAYVADRTNSRPAQTLQRNLRLSVHVDEPQEWTPDALYHTVDLLHWLTGDIWTLEVLATQPVPDPPEHGPAPGQARAVSLLSGGLDSLCGALLRLDQADSTLFLGHIDSANAVSKAQRAIHDQLRARRPELRYHRYALRPRGHARESTPRTRSLLFMAMAVAAASGNGASEVLVPENGFTSINPPLEPSRGGPLTTRSTHPWTFHALRALMAELSLSVIAVHNPYGHLTKGELVAEALRPRSADDRHLAAVTLSCAKPNAGRPKGGNPNLNCGLCIACLVRRGAFLGAKRGDETVYLVDTLTDEAKSVFLHHRRHDIAAWRYACELGFDDIRILASGLWPPGTDFDDVLAICRRGLKELRRVSVP
jgi:7-cyano-7-deazaguanine synthase in queuosine biosynthesis